MKKIFSILIAFIAIHASAQKQGYSIKVPATKFEKSISTLKKAWETKPMDFKGAASTDKNNTFYLAPVKDKPKQFSVIYGGEKNIKIQNIVIDYDAIMKINVMFFEKKPPTDAEISDFLNEVANLCRITFKVK